MQSFLEKVEVNAPDFSERLRSEGISKAESGCFKEAAILLEKSVKTAPLDNLAKAYLGCCYYALKEFSKASEMMNCDTEVYSEQVQVDTAFFNQLESYILAHQSLVWEPEAKATKGGFQSEELLHEDNTIIGQLKDILSQIIKTEFEIDLNDPDVPFKLVVWSVVLESGGNQNLHIHRSGILSGVIYVQVPEFQSTNEGALVFTQHLPWLPLENKMQLTEKQLVVPVTGKVVIFPSHFWHQTLPFESGENRISVAFDLTLKNDSIESYDI